MLVLAIKKIESKQTRESLKSKKERNSALIQNDKVLVIFVYLQAKLQRVRDAPFFYKNQ